MRSKKRDPQLDLHDYVLEQLEIRKGSRAIVSRATGVPYFTISKIALGVTKNPRFKTLQKLANYFQANPLKKAA